MSLGVVDTTAISSGGACRLSSYEIFWWVSGVKRMSFLILASILIVGCQLCLGGCQEDEFLVYVRIGDVVVVPGGPQLLEY